MEIDIKTRLTDFQKEIREIRVKMDEDNDPFTAIILEERESYILIAVHYLLSLMLEGSYAPEGIPHWWDRKRVQLNNLNPLQCLDAERFLDLYDLIVGIDNFT